MHTHIMYTLPIIPNVPQLLLTDLGWDLLTLITPRLPVKENHLYWSLVHRIVEVCLSCTLPLLPWQHTPTAGVPQGDVSGYARADGLTVKLRKDCSNVQYAKTTSER